MLEIWETERASLRDQAKVDKLRERLATLWAIETGLIERLYTIDRGVTETLADLGLGAIEQFSTAGRISPTAVKLIEDQRAALDFLFTYLKEQRTLSVSYTKELHQLLLRNQNATEAVDQFGTRFRTDLIKGAWKPFPNNPVTADGSIHEYCPPDFVQDEMDTLLKHHLKHDQIGIRPEVEAAWLHHRFTQIHPFQDGNGRVARALATMVFLKAGFLPLVIRNEEHKNIYIDALEKADAGDLAPLVNLFANIQTADLENAITFVRDIRGEGIKDIATAAANATKRRLDQDEEAVATLTAELADIAEARLTEVSRELQQAFSEAGVTLDATVLRDNAENEGYWHQQIVSAAKEYRYYADLSRFKHWIQMRLNIRSGNVARWHIVVSFHHKESRAGLMAAVVLLTTSETGFEEARPVILGADREFTYSSGSRVSTDDFRAWLEGAIKRLLEHWQSRI